MAYSVTNPPTLHTQVVNGRRVWQYESADAAATVDTAGYITNGGALGMKVGDMVDVFNTAGVIWTRHIVDSVSTTYPGATDLRDGTTIGSATDTD